MTIFNQLVAIRLLGGSLPFDMLLGPDRRIISSYFFWNVQASVGGTWLPLRPLSNAFTLLGTNSSGTFVQRSMVVASGNYSGTFLIVYKATTSGTLKWDLEFDPTVSAHYRLVYSWRDITNGFNPSIQHRQFSLNYGDASYTLDWNDVPERFGTTTTVSPRLFLLQVDLGVASSGSTIRVDPTITSNVDADALAYTFQRKVFYEPKGANYWVFYHNSTDHDNDYRYSSDGSHWSSRYRSYSGPVCCLAGYTNPDVYSLNVFSQGQTVILAWGDANSAVGTDTVYLSYMVGTISGSSISWGNVGTAATFTGTCNGSGGCQVGIRYVGVTASSTGTVVFSYNAYVNQFISPVSYLYVVYGSSRILVDVGDSSLNSADRMRSVVVPSDSSGKVRVIYQIFVNMGGNWHVEKLRSAWYDGVNIGPIEDLDSIITTGPEFSAVADPNYGTHVIYKMGNGTVNYAYRSFTGSSWSYASNLFSGPVSSPTLTIDYSTSDVYALAVKGSSFAMRSKSLAQQWVDRSLKFPVTNRNAPTNLGSNFASASSSNSNSILIVWTEGSGPYSCMFASIPIQTVWSPYASPSDPWDGTGLAPYGQYFANLGEYTSPSTGILTIRQTDLSVPGRDLNLEITRLYTEPYSFLTSPSVQPYNYEIYPWAPLGNGWQLNFPWMENMQNPSYVHLWDGEGYRIPANFWNTLPSNFENHQGENFMMVRNSTGVFLYTKMGGAYVFDPANLNRLTKIVDPVGNNINLSYDSSNRISCITDTVQRTFQFVYTNGLLSSISQTTGTCTATIVRQVQYGYSGSNLVSAKDPAGRTTAFTYDSTSWLVTQITYPTGWYDTYNYNGYVLGTNATTYRVSSQLVSSSPSSIIRQFAYSYTPGAGDQIIGTTVTSYNGTQIASYTKYAFSFIAVIKNVTDASGNLVSGDEQLFGVGGQIPREVVLVSDGSGHIGSYTNYFRYDLWGNLIYSRRVINTSSSLYHETFSDYHNNGLPIGFYSLAETISQANHTRTDNNWNITSGQWTVVNGDYRLTGERGNQSLIEVPHGDAAFQMTVRWLAGQYFEGYIGFRYQTNGNHYEVYLSAYDNTLRFVKVTGGTYARLQAATVTPSKNVFYVIRVESSGYTHTVYLNGILQFQVIDQDGSMLTGRYLALGTYSSTSPTNAEQIGFSNIYVQPLSSTFSNSFFSTGPNSNIHGSLAGTAELQSGPLSPPEEAYYSYYPWGGLNLTKSRYDPPAAQGTPNSLALDGSAIGACPNSTSSCSATLTTSNMNDIIIAYPAETLDQQFQCTFSVSDTSGLSWFNRTNVVYGRNGQDQLQEFWARSPSRLVSDTITESTSGCGTNYTGLQVFGISGANFNIPFDPSLGVPGTGSDTSGGQQAMTSTTISTANPDDFVFAGVQHGAVQVSNTQPGFTLITSGGFGFGTEYELTSSTLANFAVTFSFSTSSYWQQTADAVQSSRPTQWLTSGRTYDVYGNLKTLTDPRGNVSSYGYSTKFLSAYLTSLNQTLAPGGTLISNRYGYNFTMGTMLSSVDPNGYNTTYKYDILGRATRVTYPTNYPNNDFASYAYNDAANYVNITNENGWLTQQQYDGLGRLSTVNRLLNGKPYSNSTDTYNWQDKILTTRDPVGNTYYYSYDPLGRVTNSTTPDRKSVLQFYNNLLAWVRTIDQDGNYRCNYYDRLGRLISVVEYADSSCNPRILNGSNYVTNYYYDEVGNLRTVTNAATKSTTYSYDNLNRLTVTSYPDGTSEAYSYDNSGNLVKKVDRASIKTLSSYDSLNRLSATTYCGTTTIGTSYTYDKNNNPLQILDQNATISYIYDSRNRVLNETYAVNPATRTVVDLGCSGSGGSITRTGGVARTYTLGWTYNGEVLNTLMYPTVVQSNPDITIKYAYDGIGRVLNVNQSGTSTYYARSFTYYKNDQVKGFQFGNNLVQNYTYDRLSRPSTITLSGTTTMSLTYGYNNTGTVASVIGNVNGATVNEQYRYDPLQRLTNSSLTSSGSITTSWYEYDNLGNRARQKLNSTITQYSYNSVNELTNSTTYSTPQITTAYSYDPDGNMKTRNVTSTGTVRWQYTWDASGRLLMVTNSTGQVQYAYDGAGRMVEAAEGGAQWFIAYAGAQILYKNHINLNNYEYVYAAGLRIVMQIDRTAPSTYYFHSDALGSVRMMTYSDSKSVYTDNYQPFGQDNGTPKGSYQNRAVDKFVGERWTAATSLYYDYQRWYDPSVGRFVSEDALPSRLSDPQSSNKYGYVNNAPTTFTDPSGLGFIVGNGRLPCWDWFGLIPCHQGGVGGLLSASTNTLSTSPEGAAIVLGVIGIYLGETALSSLLSDYFVTRPPLTTDPRIAGDNGSGRTTPSPTDTIRISLPGSGQVITSPGLSGVGTPTGPRSGLANVEAGNVLSNVKGDELAGPFRGKRGVLLACVGPGVFGLGLGVLIASQPSNNPEQKDYGVNAPFAGLALFYFGCVALLGFASTVPH